MFEDREKVPLEGFTVLVPAPLYLPVISWLLEEYLPLKVKVALPALSITLMWVACQTNRFHDAKAHTDRTPPSIYLEGPFHDRIENMCPALRHDDHGVI